MHNTRRRAQRKERKIKGGRESAFAFRKDRISGKLIAERSGLRPEEEFLRHVLSGSSHTYYHALH